MSLWITLEMVDARYVYHLNQTGSLIVYDAFVLYVNLTMIMMNMLHDKYRITREILEVSRQL